MNDAKVTVGEAESANGKVEMHSFKRPGPLRSINKVL